MHTGPGVFAPRPSARARTAWVAVLLSVVVVALLGSAAPGFADGPTGGRSDDRGGADRRTDLPAEVHEKLDEVQPTGGRCCVRSCGIIASVLVIQRCQER